MHRIGSSPHESESDRPAADSTICFGLIEDSSNVRMPSRPARMTAFTDRAGSLPKKRICPVDNPCRALPLDHDCKCLTGPAPSIPVPIDTQMRYYGANATSGRLAPILAIRGVQCARRMAVWRRAAWAASISLVVVLCYAECDVIAMVLAPFYHPFG
jgi:hypothetical protein